MIKHPDKIKHVVYSFGICMVICTLCSFLRMAPVIGFFGTLSIGLYKELKDMRDPNANAEFLDMVANFIGTIAACVVFSILRILL